MAAQCDDGAVEWIAEYLGECVYNWVQYLSVAVGLLSIGCWLVAQGPQIYTNYKLKEADSLSFFFLLQWFLGDSTNLVGCILSKQNATQTFTAIYYVSVDTLLFGQFLYYTRFRKWKRRRDGYQEIGDGGDGGGGGGGGDACGPGAAGDDGGTAGVGASSQPASPAAALSPGAQRRRAALLASSGGGGADSVPGGLHVQDATESGLSTDWDTDYSTDASVTSSQQSFRNPYTRDGSHVLMSVGLVVSLGGLMVSSLTLPASSSSSSAAVAAAAAGGVGGGGRVLMSADLATTAVGKSGGGGGGGVDWDLVKYWVGIGFGYASAALYLGSRVPQLVKNFKRKSTEGLSPLMFTMAVLGNVTYALSIFIYSVDVNYLIARLAWILGSVGTLLFDATALLQFFLYRKNLPVDEEGQPLPYRPTGAGRAGAGLYDSDVQTQHPFVRRQTEAGYHSRELRKAYYGRIGIGATGPGW